MLTQSLRKQWYQELTEKFFLPCRILEPKSYNAAIRNGSFQPFLPSPDPVLAELNKKQTRALIDSYSDNYKKQCGMDLAELQPEPELPRDLPIKPDDADKSSSRRSPERRARQSQKMRDYWARKKRHHALA